LGTAAWGAIFTGLPLPPARLPYALMVGILPVLARSILVLRRLGVRSTETLTFVARRHAVLVVTLLTVSALGFWFGAKGAPGTPHVAVDGSFSFDEYGVQVATDAAGYRSGAGLYLAGWACFSAMFYSFGLAVSLAWVEAGPARRD
jgi:hypothetical protein